MAPVWGKICSALVDSSTKPWPDTESIIRAVPKQGADRVCGTAAQYDSDRRPTRQQNMQTGWKTLLQCFRDFTPAGGLAMLTSRYMAPRKVWWRFAIGVVILAAVYAFQRPFR